MHPCLTGEGKEKTLADFLDIPRFEEEKGKWQNNTKLIESKLANLRGKFKEMKSLFASPSRMLKAASGSNTQEIRDAIHHVSLEAESKQKTEHVAKVKNHTVNLVVRSIA